MGTSPKGTTYNRQGVGLPLLNGPTEFGEIHPNCTLYTTDSKRECKVGDLIFCVRGSTGKMNWADQKYSLGRGVCSIRGNSLLDTQYIRYCLAWKLDALLNFAGGSTFSNLTKDTIRNFPLPYPKSRYKIASILSAYDALIENNTRRIKILEDMAATIYRQWFVEFRFPGHENVPMVESELGSIPQGWDVAKISDIADLSRKGITPTKFPEEIFAHFSIPAFDSGCMPSIDSGDTIRSNKYLVTENCVLVSKLNPHIPRVWLPFLNIIHRAIASTEFLILKPRPPVDCVFLFNFCRSTEFSGKIAVRALGTSRSHQRVIPSDFLGLSVLLPTKSLLNSFREKVSPMLNICNNLRLKNTNLRQTRDLLLPKLISGEIDVSELDIDTEGIQPRKGIIHIPPSLSDWLHSDQKILGGKPIIRGTRLAVEFILDLLENGWSAEEIIENYPSIGTGDIAACLAYQQKATDVSVGG